MHDSHFWIIINLIVASVILAGIFSYNHYIDEQREATLALIEQGRTPAEAWCVLKLSSDNTAEMLTCRDLFFPNNKEVENVD